MTAKAPKFLRTLYDLLHVESPDIIAWSPCGTNFQVKDVARLEHEVLPRYFKHSKFASFQRQLNNFGFRKWTKTRASVCTFSHDALVKCHPQDLAQLVADSGIVSPHTKASSAGKRSRSNSETTDSGSDSDALCHETKKAKACDDEAENDELLQLLDSMFVNADELAQCESLDLSSDDLGELDWLLTADHEVLLEDPFDDIMSSESDDWGLWSQCSV